MFQDQRFTLSLVNGFLVKRDFGEGATHDSDLESKRRKIGKLDQDGTHGNQVARRWGFPTRPRVIV